MIEEKANMGCDLCSGKQAILFWENNNTNRIWICSQSAWDGELVVSVSGILFPQSQQQIVWQAPEAGFSLIKTYLLFVAKQILEELCTWAFWQVSDEEGRC